MKKKVLFIIGNLQSGGVSKSMVSLLNAFDREKFDVHLFITCTEKDIFGIYLPSNIVIHTNEDINDILSGVNGVLRLIKRLRLWLAVASMIRMALSIFNKSIMGLWLSKILPAITNDYFDLIVDYNGQHQLYYMVDKLKGKKKVSFFHSDYDKWSYYYQADRKYYPHVDAIFTISDKCVNSLRKWFPQVANRIHLMENISSPQMIRKLADEHVNVPKHIATFATLGHVLLNKGIDIAIDAAEIIKKHGIDFLWIWIGEIREAHWLNVIKSKRLETNFLFTGIQSNPYPYLQRCDIYIHPSRFEGKSIALDEAKILCKPIVVTNFSTVNDQFEDRVNASICEMDGEDLAMKIMELINSKELQSSYASYLSLHVYDNSSEVKKLYHYL